MDSNSVYLFLGVETQHWKLTDFDAVIEFCKSHSIDGIIVKVYEVTQGEWYAAIGGSSIVVTRIESAGLDCLPYGFFYGGTLWSAEATALDSLLKKYASFCLNLESDWDNNNNQSVDDLVQLLHGNKSTRIWISTWANPADHDWIANIVKLDLQVYAWMPEVYSDDLVDRFNKQFPLVTGKVYPTYSVNNVSLNKIAPSANVSLWEYGSAQQSMQWVDSFVTQQKEEVTQPVTLVVNDFGMVLDMPFFYQVEPGESEELCGNYGTAIFALSGLPNKGARGSGEDLDQLADKIATQWNTGPINEQGSSQQDMYNYLTVLDSKGNRALHFQEIQPTQDRIAIAINAGYGLLVTANEQNIRSVKTGQRPPYPWNLNANHIIPLVGLKGKDYIVADYLNNRFQNEWPCIYDASVLQPSWAVVIQVVGDDPSHPWLAPIPSGDPLNWPKGFNAQLFNQPSGNQVTNPLLKQANDVWNAGITGPTPHSMIFQAWLKLYPTLHLGQPRGKEVSTVDAGNNPIQYQEFGGGYHFEWSHIDGKSRLFDINDKLVDTL